MIFKDNKFEANKITINGNNDNSKSSSLKRTTSNWVGLSILISTIATIAIYYVTSNALYSLIAFFLSLTTLLILNPKRRFERIARLLIAYLISSNLIGFKFKGHISSEFLFGDFELNPPSHGINILVVLLIVVALILDYKTRK